MAASCRAANGATRYSPEKWSPTGQSTKWSPTEHTHAVRTFGRDRVFKLGGVAHRPDWSLVQLALRAARTAQRKVVHRQR